MTRVLYTGQSATTFVADGLPTWEPDTEMDIPEVLAKRIVQRDDFQLVPDAGQQPEPSRRGRGAATDVETMSKPDAPAAMEGS